MQSKSGGHVARAAVHGSIVHPTEHMTEQLRDGDFDHGLEIWESTNFAERYKYIAAKFNEAPVTISELCFAWESGSIDFAAIFYHPNKDATKPWRKFVRSKIVNLAMQVLECETLFTNEHLAAQVESINKQMLFDYWKSALSSNDLFILVSRDVQHRLRGDCSPGSRYDSHAGKPLSTTDVLSIAT